MILEKRLKDGSSIVIKVEPSALAGLTVTFTPYTTSQAAKPLEERGKAHRGTNAFREAQKEAFSYPVFRA